jgi:hypothetical protein
VKSNIQLALVSVVIVSCAAPQAVAQSNAGEWQFSVAPYLWAAGMDGTIRIADLEADVDLAFSDIISDLDFALMGHFDMRNDRWVLSSDLVYVDLGQSEDIVEGGIEGTVTANLDLTLIELAGGYRLSPVLTLLAGARWVDMGTGLAFSGDFVDEDADAGASWVDPLIGIHAFASLSDRWWLGVRADIGGFGVGSELTWQAYADIGFRASKLVSVMLGYHVFDMDYQDGSGLAAVELDVMISGPQLGVVFTF